ncbi:hypothetical protein M5E86_13060 [Blautia wexlerae]|nr:hypothetical protein M5E86_13060 [Blautia wexlerae]
MYRFKNCKKVVWRECRISNQLICPNKCYAKQANVIKDIVMMPTFHFHKLNGNMDGFFAIDVKTRRDPWRIIIQPLDENEEPYDPCNIDEIAGVVRIVEVKEVSNHYE